ncbi:MAG: leucine-rich repeat domain-containing protein [Bacteroidaceae bacterium]|nr:leucine-rich repeat domain-containing protein [Bacteroidaceae bacterium]
MENNGKTYTVTAIGDYAFYTSEITSITIPNTVVSIGENAFTYCRSLTSITIPASVTSIGWQAFYGCEKLQSLTISAKTAPEIGYQAFQNIPKSCVLNYPEGCYESYASWSEWFTISIPKFCINGIYYNIISPSKNTVEVTFQGSAYNSYANEYTGDVVIPETVTYGGKTYTVTAIGLSAFSGCENVTSVALPSTIKEIGEYGFNYCTKLASLNLPEGLTTIGPRALRICHSLTDVEIPASVTTIGESAFFECTSLRSITFNGAVESIGSGAFSYCSSLSNVNVSNIADWFGMGFTDYSANPLYFASNLNVNGNLLTALTVPSEITSINDYAFDGYKKLTSVNFGEGVETISSCAFRNCTGLTSLTIPANVTSIENNAFYGCTKIEEIVIEDSEETLSFGYNNDGSTTSGMFSTCYLKNPIYIGRNLSYDTSREGAYSPFNLAGWYNTIKTVTFGELVTEIPAYLLYNSGQYISDIYFQFRSNPIIGQKAFAPYQEIHLMLDDAENKDFNTLNENTFASAEYYRELEKGKFGTIMLPFAPKTDKYVFFKLTTTDDNMLIFDEEAEPKTNTPYLYKLRENAENGAIIANGSITIMADINNSELNDWQMVGSFTNQTIATENTDVYYYAYTSADNMLHRETKMLNVKPYRAYFTANGGQPAQLAIRTRGGDVTVIDATEVEDLAPMVYYDLSGRRINNPTKGMYIVNGKKVMIK